MSGQIENTRYSIVYYDQIAGGQKREQELTEAEYNTCKDSCSSRKVDPFFAILYPVRTHHLRLLAQDLLFPTTINHGFLYLAERVDKMRRKVLWGKLATVCLDLLTIPIRLATLLPRIYLNAKNTAETHPLGDILIKKEVVTGTELNQLKEGIIKVAFRKKVQKESELTINEDQRLVNLVDCPNIKKLNQVSSNSWEIQLQDCVICLKENINEFTDKNVIELKCKHIFHKKCIAPWLKKKPSCPKCRADVDRATLLSLGVLPERLRQPLLDALNPIFNFPIIPEYQRAF